MPLTPAIRVSDLFERTALAHPDLPALAVKENGTWEITTWREYRDTVRLAARSLISLGLDAGQCITILGFNRPEWFIADLAAIHAGGVPAGIYTTSSAEQCAYIAGHCEARVAFVDDAAQLAKFRSIRAQLPALRAIVLTRGEPDGDDVLSWRAFLDRGNSVPESSLEARLAAQSPADLATLIYTSGTTGTPKAVMLSHDNLTWTAEKGRAIVGVRAGDRSISYLPLSHIAEQITGLYGPMTVGACTWFVESIDTVGDNLREVRPHYFLAPPRGWEKMQEKMEAVGARRSRVSKRIVAWARGIGSKSNHAAQLGGRKSVWYPIANRLVFSKVRKAIGFDEARILVTSTAPIALSTLEFFLALDLPICEVYGMSECTGPATVSLPWDYRTGKAGKPLAGTEIRIAADGEICMRGRHVFMGYYKDPATTAETIDAEGWLHSGDIGVIDDDGFLRVTDRKKELIITAGGENIAPQMLEARLKAIPVVSQAVVFGDRRRYVAALLALDPEKIATTAATIGSPARDVASAACCERFLAHLGREIDDVNAKLARVQTVKRFAILPRELTTEGGELTPTMKLRRKIIHEKYATLIESLYEG